MPVRMCVADLTIDRATRTPLLILQEIEGNLRIPICIGLMEASAIAAAKENITLPRPMTHDLLCDVLNHLGGVLEEIVVTELKNSTFYAILRVRCDGGRLLEIDSRPSDAVALALRTDARIFVAEAVLAEAGIVDDEKDRWRKFLEELDPDDFGKYKM